MLITGHLYPERIVRVLRSRIIAPDVVTSMETDQSYPANIVRLYRQGDPEALNTLHSLYSGTILRCLKSDACSEEDLHRLAALAWDEIVSKLDRFDSGRMSLSSFVENRTTFARLRYYASPQRRDESALVENLISQLENTASPFEDDGELQDLLDALRAGKGDEDAFNRLWSKHESSLLGYIRYRLRCPDANTIAREIQTGLWLTLRAKMVIYDPNRSQFRTFAKRYADFLIKRYFTTGVHADFRVPGPSDETDLLMDPGASVEKIVIDQDLARSLLRICFNLSSPPHQLVVFGFNRLLEWKPREIVAELSDSTIRDLLDRVEEEFTASASYEAEFVGSCFRGLRDRLELPFGLAVGSAKARSKKSDLIREEVGSILLRRFYTNDADREENVVKWSGNVWKRVRAEMLEAYLAPPPG